MTGNFDELNNLTPEEKEVALQILKEYSNKGTSNTFNKIILSDYEEIPV